MTSALSPRQQALREASPLLTLAVVLSSILVLVLCIFLFWTRFRTKTSSESTRSYGHLFEESSDLEEQHAPKGITGDSPKSEHGDEIDLNGKSVWKSHSADIGGPLKPLHIQQAVLVGLKRLDSVITDSVESPRSLTSSKKSVQHRPESVTESKADMSIEALVSSHRRQGEQRDRFVHDTRNVGLRHMALDQLRMQQKSERAIMQLKLNKTLGTYSVSRYIVYCKLPPQIGDIPTRLIIMQFI